MDTHNNQGINRKWFYFKSLVWLVVLFRGAGYWITSYLTQNKEDWAVVPVFRYWGDLGYYPMIKAFSQFNFGEPNVFEHLGEGVISFPLMSSLPLAFLVKLSTNFGLCFADVIFTALSFWVFIEMFKVCGLSKQGSYVAAFAIVSNFVQYLATFFWKSSQMIHSQSVHLWGGLIFLSVALMLTVLMVRQKEVPFRLYAAWAIAVMTTLFLGSGLWTQAAIIWSMRIPRPMITDLYGIGFIVSFVRSSTSINPRQKPLWGLLAGALLSLTLQGNYHSAVILGLFSILFVLASFRMSESRTSFTPRALFAFVFGGLATLVPFLMQRRSSNPNIYKDFGEFEVSRLAPYFLVSPEHLIGLGVGISCGIVAWVLAKNKLSYESQSDKNILNYKGLISLVVSLILAGYFALPVSMITLGKVVQTSQFPQRFQIYLGISLLILAFKFLDSYYTAIKIKKSSGKTLRLIEVMGAMILLFSTLSISIRPAFKSDHFREGYYKAGSIYKAQFIELATVLRETSPCDVMATLDSQVYAWWRFSKDGCSFLVDPTSTTLDPEEAEIRLMALAKILELSPEEFIQMLDFEYVPHFWFGHLRYQTTSAFLFQDFTGYSSEQVEDIKRNGGFFATFHTITPESVQKRLTEDYKRFDLSQHSMKLDYIVLNQDRFFKNRQVQQSGYEIIFKNEVFSVWKKIIR